MSQTPLIYTIGHSTHTLDNFISLLHKHSIDCLIDVRSTPYSRIAPQFNRDSLDKGLKNSGIKYAHFAKEFGARHTHPSLLDIDGKVDFEKVRETAQFQKGIDRLRDGLNMGFRIALMCSEANPFDCHRFVMISYQLVKDGFDVQHILRAGNLVGNQLLEDTLLKKYHKEIPKSTLFETVTFEEQLEHAYKLRNRDIAYTNDTYEAAA